MPAALSRRQQLTCDAYYRDGLTDKEIAARFGVGRKAITMRRARARKRISQQVRALAVDQRARYAQLLAGGKRRMKLKPVSLSLVNNV